PPPSAPPVRVSKGVTGGDALVKVQPTYPTIAKQINASGQVDVAVRINKKGVVGEAKAIKRPPILCPAAEEGARKWVFKPTMLDGKPVKQTGTLSFIFTPPK